MREDSNDLTEKVRQLALTLGFDTCRITTAATAPHADYFHEWTSAGHMGEMVWLSRDPSRRTNPQQVLPGARSLVVVGMNYWQPAPNEIDRGRVARYAFGEDYHHVMEPKLRILMGILDKWAPPPSESKIYVDTGPVLERPLAERAGVGWQGKSTMILSEKFGPWLLLGEIITTAELAPDPPARNRCGSCSRCISACPTGAITGPYQLDARRCIAYLTIELKGSIPEEFRPLIGDRVYGCDECLEVCPWNRFAQQTKEAAFLNSPFRYDSEGSKTDFLHDLLRLTKAEFKQRFSKSPILRVKRRGLQRNGCVVLGNMGTVADLPFLREIVQNHDEPLVREHAVWAVKAIELRARVGSPSAEKEGRS